MKRRSLAARIALGALAVASLGASCGQTALGVMPGVVNDPANLSLRKAVLAHGTGRFCAEARRRSIPLRFREDDPGTGRFFMLACGAREIANGSLVVEFGGYGYVWTNLTQRLAFHASGVVEYETDFRMDGSTMYVYFRQRSTPAANFTTRLIERPEGPGLGGLPGAPGGRAFADTFGAELLKREIARGFTVIRKSSGETAFGFGVIEKGQRPPAPFQVDGRGRAILAHDRSEVHQNQRDFVGPIDVPEGGELDVSIAVDGAPAVDVLLVPRAMGDAWLYTYTSQAPAGPPPGRPIADEPAYSGAAWHRTYPVPRGSYYLVLDNTPTAGRTMPTAYAHDDRAALVSYAVVLK